MTSSQRLLQNHVGDVEFPVRRRQRYAAASDTARRQDSKAMGRRGLLLMAFAAPAGLIAYGIALMFYPTGVELANPFISFVGGLFAGLLIGVVFFNMRDSGAPRRAQLNYLDLSRRSPTTERQQHILALDASSDFAFRGWNSSLAFAPTFAELPDHVRRRYRDGVDGSPWRALPIASLAAYRAALDEQFKVASRTDIEVLTADTLSIGPLSQRFAEIAAGEHGEHMMSRVAALSGVDVFDVMDLSRATGDRPALLLLAGDVERTIGAIRYAYVSGYVSADEAWNLLEPIATRVFNTYPNWEAYWREALIATAFRSDSLNAVQRQRENLEQLRRSSWPAATIPYPTA